MKIFADHRDLFGSATTQILHSGPDCFPIRPHLQFNLLTSPDFKRFYLSEVLLALDSQLNPRLQTES
jgi:hypothetical protein